MPALAHVASTTPHSAIRTVGQLARSIPGALRLESGDPDFGTPEHVIAAAASAARAGYTHYGPSAGIDSLREAIAAKATERNGFDCHPEQVVVTAGACGALYTTLATLVDPGAEVLIPDPGWSNYPAMLHVLGARMVGYTLDASRGWAPDLGALEAAITDRTRAILVNSPANPGGAMLGLDDVRALCDIAARHDLWLISDECYDEIVFEGIHHSLAAHGDPDRIVSIFSFSKTYAMTGWRIGYLAAPVQVAGAIARSQEPVYSCAATLTQKAAEAALLGPQDIVVTMRDAYRARRDRAMRMLDAAGVRYVRPEGAFYLMAAVPDGETSLQYAERLLQEQAVAVVPGSAFGPHGEGYIRIALSVADGVLDEAIARIVRSNERPQSGREARA